MRWFATLLLVIAATPASAQCVLGNRTPHASTCLIYEYALSLERMAAVEERVKTGFPDSLVEEKAFYALKSRIDAERRTLTLIRPYLRSRDTMVAESAKMIRDGFSILLRWDSTGQESYRRIVNFKLSLSELQEQLAQKKVNEDKVPELLMAMAGAALDANLILSKRDSVINRRRMTAAERDSIVAFLDRAFAGHQRVEADGLWYSGWAATAWTIKDNLMNPSWIFAK